MGDDDPEVNPFVTAALPHLTQLLGDDWYLKGNGRLPTPRAAGPGQSVPVAGLHRHVRDLARVHRAYWRRAAAEPGAEVELTASALGRLAALRLVGVDVGATSVDVAVTDPRCDVLAHVSEPCDIRQGPTPVLARVLAMTATVLRQAPGRLVGVGIGVPGPVSYREGMLVAPPIMPGWDRYPVRDHLASRWGCPVVVDNDVNVMALGERHAGVARSQDDFVFVKVGTGIGCGIVMHGQVYRGVQGAAGDIGGLPAGLGAATCVSSPTRKLRRPRASAPACGAGLARMPTIRRDGSRIPPATTSRPTWTRR